MSDIEQRDPSWADEGPFKRRTWLGYPPLGWTCFHCGETFTTPGAARDHFGGDASAEPACQIKAGAERGLVMALRKAEEQAALAMSAIHDENTEMHRVLRDVATRHLDALEHAEKAGYERGLRAARRRCAEIAHQAALSVFDGCERLGDMDPETGQQECSLDVYGKDCLCQVGAEMAEKIAEAIENHRIEVEYSAETPRAAKVITGRGEE